jgi:hypothetical protein
MNSYNQSYQRVVNVKPTRVIVKLILLLYWREMSKDYLHHTI